MSFQYLTNITPPPTESVLQYDVEPATVFVSTGTEQMYANLTITVSNTASTAVNCMEFQFGFLAGAQTGNLTTAAEAAFVTASSDQNEWDITPQGSFSNSGNQNLYLFRATPSGISNYLSLAAGASLVFHLNNILIDQSVGEGSAPFTIIEQTGTNNVSKQTVQGTLPIEKETATLSITAFNVDPPTPIAPGTPIELSWTVNGSDRLQLYNLDADELLYDSQTGPPLPSNQWPVSPQTLTPEKNTNYEIIAWAGQLFTARSAEAMVASPQVTATGPSGPVNALSNVVIQWTSSNAQTVTIQPTGQTAGATGGQGTFTVQPTEDTQYTLTAKDAQNNQSQPASVQVYVNPPQITSFSASPATCQPEASVNLSWATQSASSASLSQSIVGGGTNNLGSVDLNSSGHTVTPTGISIYTLTAASEGQAARQTAVAVTGLSVNAPRFPGVTYDNQNNLIWVVDQDETLYGLNPSNGSVSRQPISLTIMGVDIIFDGTYLWVVSPQANAVAQIEASTGNIVNGQIQVGSNPDSLVYDWVNKLVWVVNDVDATVSRIDATAGTIVGDVVTISEITNTSIITFDGSNVWAGGSSILWLIPASRQQSITPTAITSANFGATGLAFDGSNVWAACEDSTAKKFDSQGKVLASYPIGNNPAAILSDGPHLWTANVNDSTVTMLLGADGTNLGTFPVAARPYQLAFDGSSLWVYVRSDDGTISELIKL